MGIPNGTTYPTTQQTSGIAGVIGGGPIRERTLPELVQETQGYINEALAILDQVDPPRNGSAGGPATEWTLMGGSASLCERSSMLVGRLKTLFGDLPAPGINHH